MIFVNSLTAICEPMTVSGSYKIILIRMDPDPSLCLKEYGEAYTRMTYPPTDWID